MKVRGLCCSLCFTQSMHFLLQLVDFLNTDKKRNIKTEILCVLAPGLPTSEEAHTLSLFLRWCEMKMLGEAKRPLGEVQPSIFEEATTRFP